jgi:hypothetical protein
MHMDEAVADIAIEAPEILLLGFAGAFRRSELVALDVGDLEFCEGGMRVHIRRSKTDQEGAGHTIAIVSGSIACPVRAMRAWLEASNIATGPLFRPIGKGDRIGTERLTDHTVVRVVKASARRRSRSQALRRAFAPFRLPHIGGRARRLDHSK